MSTSPTPRPHAGSQSQAGVAVLSPPFSDAAPAEGPERSPLRTIGDLLVDMGIVRIAGNRYNGVWRYRLTFYSQERGVHCGEGSGTTLGEAYQAAIADSKTVRK